MKGKVFRQSACHLVLGAAFAGTLGACYATVQPDAAVYEPAPPNIEAYPSVVYEGHPVYFYNDHWYYRGGGGAWVNYRVEPEELRRQHAEMARRPAPRPGVRADVHVEAHEEGREERR